MIIDKDYEKFKSGLFAAILQRVEMEGKHVRLLGREGRENKGEMLCVVWREEDGKHMLYWELSVLYSNFQKEGWEGILPEMIYKLRLYGILKKGMNDEMPESLLRRTEAYEDIILRPLNYDYFRNELKDSLYWRFGDIALVLYRTVYKDAGGNLAEKVNRRATEQMPDSDNIILTNALFTTYSEMPPTLHRGTECVRLSNEKMIKFIKDGVIGYRLSTVSGTNGAVALFYPGVRQRLAELFGGDYYVGFISVHEAVIYPVRYKRLGKMKEALMRVNALCDKREMLTNNVYRYCGGQNRFVEV